MIREEIGSGSTIEEAAAAAVKKLEAPEGVDVKTEVTDTGTKKFFGLFGSNIVKVRAYYELPDEAPAPAAPAKDAAAKKPAPAKQQEKAASKAQPKQEPKPAKKPIVQSGTDYTPAKNYIAAMLGGMGIENPQIEISEIEDGLNVELDCGDDYGVVIGRRGETLDAIQYLLRLFVNKGNTNYKRVSVNVGNYREKRENTLTELAKKNAAKVLKYGRNVVLEPMNPYERRVIHTAVQAIEGVESHSIGADLDRRVVISLAPGFKATNPGSGKYNNDKRRDGYKDGSRDSGKGNGSRSGDYRRNDRPKTQNAPSQPQRPPRSDINGTSRYGKIERPAAANKSDEPSE